MAAFDRIKLLRLIVTFVTFYTTLLVTASEQAQEISVVHLAKGFFGYLA